MARNYAEVPMNLVTVPQGWLVCFATDCEADMSMGLPKLMNDMFHLKKKIADNIFNEGTAQIISNVAMLIVKDNCYDTADEDSLRSSLEDLKSKCEQNGFDKIAMPKLCSGMNGLRWKKVKRMIREIFRNSDIFVMICI